MALYVRKPPVLVHAEQWDGSNESQDAIIEMLKEGYYHPLQITALVGKQELIIAKHGGGRVSLPVGKWVVLHTNGTFFVQTDERFREMYQRVDTEEPRKQETHGTDDTDGEEGGEVVLQESRD